MPWLQLTLETDKDSAEQLSELLDQFGAISISLSAASNEAIYGQGVISEAELWDHTRITTQLHEDTDLDVLLVCLRDRVGAERIIRHHINLLKDKDWINEYKQGQRPIDFGEQLCICPSWCEPPEEVNHYIILDPGLVFGTGTHVTTALCLEWLANNDNNGQCVIDFGCGSGILALAALRLGATAAYAVDIDPQAIQATQENAERNHLTENMTIAHPDEIELPTADILLANILSGPLQELASDFAKKVKPQGKIVLSGILAVQTEDCLSTYASWFNMGPPLFRQEWALLQGTRL